MSTGRVDTSLRDFDRLRAGWLEVGHPDLTHDTIGEAGGLPIDHLRLAGPSGAPRLLLAAGTHGDEPAGPETMVRLLHTRLARLAGRVETTLIPCLNPWGYVHDRRENEHGVDINRAFEQDEVAQVAHLKRVLDGERFDLFLEFHEDWEFSGFYLFEIRAPGAAPLGRAVIDAARRVGPICTETQIDDVPLEDGVAAVTPEVLERLGERVGCKALPLWLFRSGRAAHTITAETPSRAWDLERRIEAHLAALDTALAHLAPGADAP